MNAMLRAAASGFAGALATNVSHEIVRRVTPLAPRVDLLGMQALAKMYRAVDADPPTGRTLYVRTLIGDIISNSAYFALAALAGSKAPVLCTGLGVVAGAGAFLVPEKSDLDELPTARTPATKILVVGLYTLGGAVAGLTYAALFRSSEKDSCDNGTRLDASTVDRLTQFGETVEACRVSATAAFSSIAEADHASFDERALADFKQVGETLAGLDELHPAAAGLARTIADRYEAAQVQLMALTINRKNREASSEQSQSEIADLASFKRDTEELRDRLNDALSRRRI